MSPHETKLWERYEKTRSIEDRNALVELFQPLVASVAWRRFKKIPRSAGLEVADLVNDATPALIWCIERFERSRGWSFQTYAAQRIGGALFDSLRDMDWVPRLERSKQKTGEVTEVAKIEANSASPVFERTKSPRTVDQIDEEDFWREACRSLSKVEKLMVLMYFRADATMKDIGRSLSLSESRVSQVMSKILQRLGSNNALKDRLSAA